MPKFAAKISYSGTSFHGWQRQNNAHTVQGEIESALSVLYGDAIGVVGCGRTDTGVHASFYVLHFEVPDKYPLEQLKYKLNAILPSSIAFYQIMAVQEDFHARFDATDRSYIYQCHTYKDPFLEGVSMRLMYEPNLELMNEAANYFIGKKDFGAFQKQDGGNKTNICAVTKAFWEENHGRLFFHVSANRFLRNMVRAMVGTLLEVGREKIPPDSIKEILSSGDRSQAGESVKACGLYLNNIVYPNITSWQKQQ